MFAVRIYEINRGVALWRWLCARCLKALQAEGWFIKDSKDPPHELACDGDACRWERVKAGRKAA